MISFREDSAENVVDDWLGPSEASKTSHVLPSVDLPKTNQRLGLGFQGSKKQNTHNLAAKKDKKRVRSDEVVGDLHGVIEDDVEDSKLSAVAKKPKHQDIQKNNQQATKPPLKANTNNTDSTNAKADDSNKAGSGNTNTPTPSHHKPSAASQPAPKNSGDKQSPRPSHQQGGRGGRGDGGRGGGRGRGRGHGDYGRAGKPKEHGSQPILIDRGEIVNTHNDPTPPKPSSSTTSVNTSEGSATSPYKRKRPKTRSKQKNIRRDHRSDDQKPAHLQLGGAGDGGEEYRGRVLTEETKRRMQIT